MTQKRSWAGSSPLSRGMIVQGKNTNYKIRLASTGDLAALPAIEQAAAQQFAEFELAHLENISLPTEALIDAQKSDHVWVITTATKEIVGFAVVSVDKDRLHLEEIDIHPNHSRQGLGRSLINLICDWARATSFNAITLSTFRDIPWNAPYYKLLGFRAVPQSQ